MMDGYEGDGMEGMVCEDGIKVTETMGADILRPV